MKIKAFAKLHLKKPDGVWKDDPGFTDEQLSRLTEVAGLERHVVDNYAKYEAVYIDHYLDDPIYQKVIRLLEEEMGRTICYANAPREISRSKMALSIQLTKEFEVEDLDDANYFALSPEKEIGSIDMEKYWDDDASCSIVKSSITKIKHRIGNFGGSGFNNRVLCDQFIKKEIESNNFLGLDFLERELVGRGKEDIQIYELVSEIVLPATCNSFMGKHRVPLRDYTEEGTCNISQESVPAQLEYIKEALESFPDFDVAITSEIFGSEVPDQKPSRYRFPKMVVSRKFREWCIGKKWKLDFYPIKEIS